MLTPGPQFTQRSGGRAGIPAGLPSVVWQARSHDQPHGMFHSLAEYWRKPLALHCSLAKDPQFMAGKTRPVEAGVYEEIAPY